MSDFEEKVLEDLAELKTHMRWVVGDGNKGGKIGELEERVDRHEAFLQRAKGISVAFGSLVTMINLAFSFLRWRH